MRRRDGWIAWAVGLGWFAVWDALVMAGRRRRRVVHETASEAAWRLWGDPLGRSALLGLLVTLASHLWLEPFWHER